MQKQPIAERIHIGFFGKRNAGKSSLVNAIANQQVSLVSEVLGTTTDPVQKTMELLPAGAVVLLDTPGIDDCGELGKKRVGRTMEILRKTDFAVLVADATIGLQKEEKMLLEEFQKQQLPYLIVYNKAERLKVCSKTEEREIYVSVLSGLHISELREKLGEMARPRVPQRPLVLDLVAPGELVVLVTPIDAAAPKGRLILPQQQVLRELLDCGAIVTVTKETELSAALSALSRKPKLVITDSQVFGKVSKIVPEDILLTSFSILFAHLKGDLEMAVHGAARLAELSERDRILISEGCTHRRQCGDIGTEKLPRWIREYAACEPQFDFTSGADFPTNPEEYAVVIHCGGCMLNAAEMQARVRVCKEKGVPMTNYGIAIAQMHGILPRSLSPFPELRALAEKK